MTGFYYFEHFGTDPFFNMGFDEWMLTHVLSRPGAFLLRAYTWCEGAITIGYNQTFARAVRAAQLGTTPMLRRATGGRAIFHDTSEFTYSLAVNQDERLQSLQGGVSRAHGAVAIVLLDFLKRFGVDAELVAKSYGESRKCAGEVAPPCFDSAARYEIMSGGRKVLASAHRRIRGAFLQHGSVKLKGMAGHPALASARSVEPQLHPIGQDDLARMGRSLREAFADAFGVQFNLSGGTLTHGVSAAKRIDEVRKFPLARRDFVERMGWPGSL